MAENNTHMGLAPALVRAPVAKTASYYLKEADIATIFTNRGASADVTFTLPPTSALPAGWWVEFFVVANQGITVAPMTADTLVAFNNATADSITLDTSNERIGAGVTVIWDGTGWLAKINLGADSQTVTVTDS